MALVGNVRVSPQSLSEGCMKICKVQKKHVRV